jgi:hypothetical protein
VETPVDILDVMLYDASFRQAIDVKANVAKLSVRKVSNENSRDDKCTVGGPKLE